MKKQNISFELNKELSKKADNDLRKILRNEGAKKIVIDFDKVDKVIVAYNKKK